MNKIEGKKEKQPSEATPLPKCGIIMPISAIDNCPAEHWSELLSILRDIISNAGFDHNLVSDADDIGIIQKRIIQNLYSNEVVVCDVSCKNPNVMFELGIRLAFDKPTIIIKDDKTDYTFDTSLIEHLVYPRDLRFSKIVAFKENLKKKIQATHSKAIKDPNYSTFLKSFGEYKIAHLSEKEISSDKYILNSLEEIKNEIYQVKRNQALQNDLNRPKKIVRSLSSRNQEAHRTIDRLIDEFVNKISFGDRTQLKKDDKLVEQLFNYLESNIEVHLVCDGPDEIREIMNYQLDMPF